MGISQSLRQLWERVFPQKVEMPSQVLDSSAPGIVDGVDYHQPITLPGYLREQLEKDGKLQEWLSDQRDTYRMQFDTPGRGRSDLQIMPTTEDPLREWYWTTRMQVLSTCHSAYQRNPVAKRAIYYMMAFTVGDGFNLNCQNPEVEKVIQDFIDNPDNAVREYERQAPIDLLVDGEIFLRIFEDDGEIVAAPMRPWEVQYIRTEPGFFRRPVLYHIQPYSMYNTDDPASAMPISPFDVQAPDMMHVAINRMGYELRGRPELYSALPWLRAHKEWQENRARQNHWRGALLWWVKIASQVPSVIAAKLAQYQRPPTPGSTVVTSDKEEWQALTNPVGAGDASEDGRQLKLMALNGLGGIPEYMTGDGQNSNLATTKTQQLPVLMTFRMLQVILTTQVWMPLFTRVVQSAIDAGTLPAQVECMDSTGKPILDKATGATKTIDTLKAFSVEYEPLGTSDPFTLAQAVQIAQTGGWISKQTAATEMGYDWAQEEDRIADERQSDVDAMASGLMPMPPGQVPAGMEDPNAQDTSEPAEPEKAVA